MFPILNPPPTRFSSKLMISSSEDPRGLQAPDASLHSPWVQLTGSCLAAGRVVLAQMAPQHQLGRG